MKLTIIVPDNIVVVDGVPRSVDCSALSTVHAIQWDGAAGMVEYVTGQLNDAITDISPYQSLIDAWTAAGIVPPPPPPTLTDLIVYANRKQWSKATGGYNTTINGQAITFPTSTESMTLISGKAARFQQPSPPASVQWQIGATSFVTITAADFMTLANSVADFVQSTFDELATVIGEITAGTITTTAQIDAAFT